MDTDQMVQNWIDRLEELLRELDASVADIEIMREGIKTTLARIKKRERSFCGNNGSDRGESHRLGAERVGQTNTGVVSNYLSALQDNRFTVLSAWKGFSKAHPDILTKDQFKRAFGKIAWLKPSPLELVEKRPGNIPNVYKWSGQAELPDAKSISEREHSQ